MKYKLSVGKALVVTFMPIQIVSVLSISCHRDSDRPAEEKEKPNALERGVEMQVSPNGTYRFFDSSFFSEEDVEKRGKRLAESIDKYDLEIVFAELNTLDGMEFQHAIWSFMRQLVARSGAGAAEYIDLITNEKEREFAAVQFFIYYAKHNPEEAFRMIDQVPYGDKKTIRTRVIAEWAKQDPAAASREYVSLAESGENDSIMDYEVPLAFWKKDPGGMIKWLRSGTDNKKIRRSGMVTMIQHFEGENGQLVADLIAEFEFENLSSRLAKKWAGYNPVEVLEWAEKVEDVRRRNEIQVEAAIALFDQSPEAALEVIHAFSDTGGARSRGMEAIGEKLKENAPSDVFPLIESYATSSFDRDDIFGGYIRQYAGRDFVGAMDMMDRFESEKSKHYSQGYVADLWIDSNPQEFIDWLRESSSMFSSDLITRSTQRLAIGGSLDAVHSWVESLAPSVTRDAAILGLIRHVADHDYDRAIKMGLEIQDDAHKAAAERLLERSGSANSN